MEVRIDIPLKGEKWTNTIKNLSTIFADNTHYSVYILAVAIGIAFDKIEETESGDVPEKILPRNVLSNNGNANGLLDLYFQTAVLSSQNIEGNPTEDERIKSAFGDNTEDKLFGDDNAKIRFLTKFANFGVKKISETIGDNDLQTAYKLNELLCTIATSTNVEIDEDELVNLLI